MAKLIARIVQHPLGVVVLHHRRRDAEDGGVEADVGIEVIDRDMDVKAFHDLLLAGLRFGAGGQQRVSAVSIVVEALLRHALAAVLGQKGHQAGHALEVRGCSR